MKRHGFSHRERLHLEIDFRNVLRGGRRKAQGPFMIYVRKRNLLHDDGEAHLEPFPRLGIVVSRVQGKANCRNLAKRFVREAFRHHKDQLPAADYVVRIYKPLAPFSRTALRAAAAALFQGVCL